MHCQSNHFQYPLWVLPKGKGRIKLPVHCEAPSIISLPVTSSGLTRTERDRGTIYELMFKAENPQAFTQVALFRPFGPLVKVKSECLNTHNILVNIIIPLSKRTEAFRHFISNFR